MQTPDKCNILKHVETHTQKLKKLFKKTNEHTNAFQLLSYPTWTTCGTRSPGLLRGNNNAKESSRRQIEHLRELGSTNGARGRFDESAGGVAITTPCVDVEAEAAEEVDDAAAAGVIDVDKADEDDMGGGAGKVSNEASAVKEEEEEVGLETPNGGFGAFAI